MGYKSQHRTVQAILRGLLHDPKVVEAIESHWNERGLFESPEANHIAKAAIEYYHEYQEVMQDSSAWLDTLAAKTTVKESEVTDTEALWNDVLGSKAHKTKVTISKAEEYFEQVKLNRLITQVEDLTERGLHDKARDAVLNYQPLILRGRGFLQQASEDDIVLIKYLFKPFLAYGYITLLEGHSGTGKTTMLCDLIARISNGWKMPPEDPVESKNPKPKNVLYITSEDGWRDMTLPRLKAAGADFARVFCWPIDESNPTFPKDINLLERKIVQNKIKFVILDPIVSFMEDQFSDTNSAAHVRRIMDSLNKLAQKQRIAFLAVRHFTKKGSGTEAMHRGSGSGAWTQACRFQYFTTRHPDQQDEYVLVPSKVNTVASMNQFAMRFRIDSVPVHSAFGVDYYGRVTWKKLSKKERGKSADDWLRSDRKATI